MWKHWKLGYIESILLLVEAQTLCSGVPILHLRLRSAECRGARARCGRIFTGARRKSQIAYAHFEPAIKMGKSYEASPSQVSSAVHWHFSSRLAWQG